MAAGSKINHPRSVCGKKQRSRKQSKKLKAKKVAKVTRIANKLSRVDLTTDDILRKTRTNPSANIELSGKKKRLLMKQIKRDEAEKRKMDQDVEVKEKPVKNKEKENDKMETE